MVKNKIRVIKQKFIEIKKPFLREVKQAQESEEGVEEETGQEKEGEEQEEFSDFESLDLETERRAPVPRPTSREEGQGGAGEELEDMLGGVESNGKERGGIGPSSDEELKYDFEKPKYSFSERGIGGAEEMEELRHVVLRETPTLIEKTPEAREMHDARIQDSMLENLGIDEYAVKYVPMHKQELLEESEEVKGKKIDIRKYRKER